MSGPTTTQRPSPGAPARYRQLRPWHLLVTIISVGSLVLVSRLMEPPTFIDRITVQNPTRYDITIYVTEGDRDGWMAVGTARREDTEVFEEIFDQGEVWIFRFTAQGKEGGELRVTKSQLEQSKWRIEIPRSVGDELQDKGAPFPP